MRIADFDLIISSGHLSLVDFYSTWCGACRAIDPALDRLIPVMGDMVTVVRVDIDEPDTRALVRRYNIVSVPTLILFLHGEQLWRNSGVLTYEHLSSVMRRYGKIGRCVR